MPTFVANFEPERGELLYGLRDTRTQYLEEWARQTKTTDLQRVVDFLTPIGKGKANWNIIDNFNDYFFLGGAVNFSESGDKNSVPYQLYARLKSVETTLSSDPAKSLEQLEQRATYVEGLAKSRFSPANSFTASKEKLAREGFSKNFKRDGKKIGKSAALLDNRAYLAIRRACKYGIGMAASKASFSGNKVHFLLDGLDMVEVTGKGTRQGYGGRTSVSITTSELRYVYRNWSKLQTVVKFYVNLNEVNAPWVTDWTLATVKGKSPNPIKAHQALWTTYGTQRTAKYKGNIPDKSLT